jgi:hypothetical protein
MEGDMAKFLFVYYGGKMDATPAAAKKTMDAWIGWFTKQGKAVVDSGNPTMPVKLVTKDGVKTITGKKVTGYSIFSAPDMDAAIAIAKSSPQMNGGEIAVYTINSVM